MIAYNFLSPYILGTNRFDNSQQTEEIKTWLALTKEKDSSDERTHYSSLIPEKDASPLLQRFKFNPNNATDDELLRLGFTKRNIESLRKYLQKGGNFKIKNDFSKMYFVTEEVFQEVYPYIDLPEKIEYEKNDYGLNLKSSNNEINTDKQNFKHYEYASLLVEINSADTTELKKIKVPRN